jgi:hypothetical protein
LRVVYVTGRHVPQEEQPALRRIIGAELVAEQSAKVDRLGGCTGHGRREAVGCQVVVADCVPAASVRAVVGIGGDVALHHEQRWVGARYAREAAAATALHTRRCKGGAARPCGEASVGGRVDRVRIRTVDHQQVVIFQQHVVPDPSWARVAPARKLDERVRFAPLAKLRVGGVFGVCNANRGRVAGAQVVGAAAAATTAAPCYRHVHAWHAADRAVAATLWVVRVIEDHRGKPRQHRERAVQNTSAIETVLRGHEGIRQALPRREVCAYQVCPVRTRIGLTLLEHSVVHAPVPEDRVDVVGVRRVLRACQELAARMEGRSPRHGGAERRIRCRRGCYCYLQQAADRHQGQAGRQRAESCGYE